MPTGRRFHLPTLSSSGSSRFHWLVQLVRCSVGIVGCSWHARCPITAWTFWTPYTRTEDRCPRPTLRVNCDVQTATVSHRWHTLHAYLNQVVPAQRSYSSSLRVEGSADLVTQTSQHQPSPMVDQEPREASGAPCTAPDDMCYTHCTGWCSLQFVDSSEANTRHPLPDECNPVCPGENGEPWR